MIPPSPTDWISSIGTVVAAVAAIAAAVAAVFAARYTKAAVYEAAKSAQAAAAQVDLQRPRPIILATFSYSLKEQRNMADPKREFLLENIGDSPAFDVEVSSMEIPDGSYRLGTERLSYLKPGQSRNCAHRLEPASGVLGVLVPAEIFANQLSTFFGTKRPATLSKESLRHQLPFTLSYLALDGRQLTQHYVFVVYFLKQRAWIEPVGSLLDVSAGNVMP